MKAKRLSSKILSAVLAFLFVFTLIPISAVHVHAAESESITYLALGDSISTGYGLGNPTADGFTYRLASATGYTLINKAVDGNTSADILDQLNNSQNAKFVSSAELAEADVITVTVGGNDLMALLYEKTAEQTADTTDTAADIPTKLQNGDYEALVAAINLLTESREMYIVNDEDFPIAIDGIIANLNAIITKIRSVNSHAEIVVATQYNPYVEFENAVLAILPLSAVYKGMEAGVNALNEAIVDNAAGKYTVSNVKEAFDGYTGTEDLYNAQPPAGGATAINVDFHPTAAGHKLLADTLAATFESLDISDAPTTVTVETPYDSTMFAGVTGAGEYEVGESVTLTATTFTDGYDTVFYYWLDNSVELSDAPTEEELRAAIVSYSPTFTFTAAENVSYTPIADYDTNKLQVYVEGCLFEDDNFTSEGDGWGYTTEYDQVLFVGDEEVTVSLDSFPKTLTVEDKLYLRVGFVLWDLDGNGEGGLVLLEDTAITVPTAPIYNSADYWDWCNKYASITVAYLPHTHSYETRFDEEGNWKECDCGEKLESDQYTKDFVYEKTVDGKIVGTVTVVTPEGVELPEDAEMIVKDYTATLAPFESAVGADIEIEYITVDNDNISVNSLSVVLNGVTFYRYEIIVINDEEFYVHDIKDNQIIVIRFSDGAICNFDGKNLKYMSNSEAQIEKRENQRVNINGITYDVVAVCDRFSTLDCLILYYNGRPAGEYEFEMGQATFNEGYDPETLKAQQQDTGYIGTITVPGENPIVGLTPGKTYTVCEAVAQDISLNGWNEALRAYAIGDSPEVATAKAEVERLKADMEAKWAALDQLDANDPKHMEVWAAWNEAETAYNEALVALVGYKAVTVTQSFRIPAAYVNDPNVKFVAVHDTNPYAEALAEATQKHLKLREAVAYAIKNGASNDETIRLRTEQNKALKEYTRIRNLYNTWEAEHGSSAQFGKVEISAGGLTATVTHNAYGFSPFVVYALVEVDEPEIKALTATVHTEHTGGTATCTEKAVCEVCGESYGELATSHDYENGICALCGEAEVNDGLETWVIVLIVVASVLVLAGGGFAVYWFVIRKKK